MSFLFLSFPPFLSFPVFTIYQCLSLCLSFCSLLVSFLFISLFLVPVSFSMFLLFVVCCVLFLFIWTFPFPLSLSFSLALAPSFTLSIFHLCHFLGPRSDFGLGPGLGPGPEVRLSTFCQLTNWFCQLTKCCGCAMEWCGVGPYRRSWARGQTFGMGLGLGLGPRSDFQHSVNWQICFVNWQNGVGVLWCGGMWKKGCPRARAQTNHSKLAVTQTAPQGKIHKWVHNLVATMCNYGNKCVCVWRFFHPCLLPIACCLFPIAYRLLPIAYCLLPIAYCPLPIAHCLLPNACCLLPIVCCLLPICPFAHLPIACR